MSGRRFIVTLRRRATIEKTLLVDARDERQARRIVKAFLVATPRDGGSQEAENIEVVSTDFDERKSSDYRITDVDEDQ